MAPWYARSNYPTSYLATPQNPLNYGIPVGALMARNDASLHTMSVTHVQNRSDFPSGSFVGGAGTVGDPWHWDRLRCTSSWYLETGGDLNGKYLLFTNSFFFGSPTNPTNDTSNYVQVQLSDSALVRFEDCTMGPNATIASGHGPPSGTGGVTNGINIGGSWVSFLRCDMWGANVTLAMEYPYGGTHVSVADTCFLHDNWLSSGDHHDVINGHDPGAASHWLIQNCTLDGRATGGRPVANLWGIYNGVSGQLQVRDWTFINNWCAWSINSYLGAGVVGAIVVDHNVFSNKGAYGSCVGAWDQGGGTTTWTNNVDTYGTAIASPNGLANSPGAGATGNDPDPYPGSVTSGGPNVTGNTATAGTVVGKAARKGTTGGNQVTTGVATGREGDRGQVTGTTTVTGLATGHVAKKGGPNTVPGTVTAGTVVGTKNVGVSSGWSTPVAVPWDPWQGPLNRMPVGYSYAPRLATLGVILLGDGSVLFDAGQTCFRLYPDRQGNYATGTFKRCAARATMAQYYSGAVLADGRVIVINGEYRDSNNTPGDISIYDPAADTWTAKTVPWSPYNQQDIPASILATGNVLIGNGGHNGTGIGPGYPCMVYDSQADTFTATNSCTSSPQEAGFQLRQDGTAVCYNGWYNPFLLGTPTAMLYTPGTNSWASMPTAVDWQVEFGGTQQAGSGGSYNADMGPLIGLTNGDVLQLGSTGGKTARLRADGTWVNGPVMPTVTGLGSNGSPSTATAATYDHSAAILPNGHWLVACGPQGEFTAGPILEFDGTTFAVLADQPSQAPISYSGFMCPLPSGQVLLIQTGLNTSSTYGHTMFSVYTPSDPTPPAGAAPIITSLSSTTLTAGSSYIVNGTRLNGVTTGNGMKDEKSFNANFPIVCLTYSDGTKLFCRTRNSRLQSDNSPYMGISPSAATRADFTVPADAPNGACTLTVVTAGMASAGTAVTVTGGATYRAPLAVTGGTGQHWTATGGTDAYWDGRIWQNVAMVNGQNGRDAGTTYVTPSITVTGGTGPYTWQVVGAPLPTGLTVTSNAGGAWIAGSTGVAPLPIDTASNFDGSFDVVTVEATDSLGAKGQAHILYMVGAAGGGSLIENEPAAMFDFAVHAGATIRTVGHVAGVLTNG